MNNTKHNKAVRVGGARRKRPNYGNLTEKERRFNSKTKITGLFKGRIQGVDKVDACSFEYAEKITVFETPELKVLFDEKRTPFGYYFSGVPKDIMNKNQNIPEDFEAEVAKLQPEENKDEEKVIEEIKEELDNEEQKVENISDDID